MKVKTLDKKKYMREYMKRYYEKNKERIKTQQNNKYINYDLQKKNEIKKNNLKRNIKRYYLMLLSYKYLKETAPDIIQILNEKVKDFIKDI